jgi:hypothetical protein
VNIAYGATKLILDVIIYTFSIWSKINKRCCTGGGKRNLGLL